MTTFRGQWRASVVQDFEIDAETEAEARELLEDEIRPSNVVELLDIAWAFEEPAE